MKDKIIKILKSHSYHHTEGVGVKSQFKYLAEIAFECCADEIMLALDQSQFTADEAKEHINQEVEKRIAERMPPAMYGWICPRCGAVHSPYSTACHCLPPVRTWTGTSTGETEGGGE